MKPAKLPVIIKVICRESGDEVDVNEKCRGKSPCPQFRGPHSTGHVLCCGQRKEE